MYKIYKKKIAYFICLLMIFSILVPCPLLANNVYAHNLINMTEVEDYVIQEELQEEIKEEVYENLQEIDTDLEIIYYAKEQLGIQELEISYYGYMFKDIFPDPMLALIIAEYFGKLPTDHITIEELNNFYVPMVYISNSNIESLEGIQHLTSITSLMANGNRISDIEPLSGMASLRELYINNNEITNLQPLYNTNRPFFMYAENQTIELEAQNELLTKDIFIRKMNGESPRVIITSPVGGSYDNTTGSIQWSNYGTNYLYWEDENFSGIIRQQVNEEISTFIDYFPDKNLAREIAKNFDRSPTDTVTKEELNNFTGVFGILNISDLNIQSIEGLQYLTNINHISAFNNNISNIEPLRWLTKLEGLDISNNKIIDLDPLKELNNLSYLNITDNYINDLEPIKELTNLMTIRAENNKITSLEPLRGLSNLWRIEMANNNIIDLEPLRDLIGIKNISMSNNNIISLEPLRGLTNLVSLEMNYNNINDLDPLRDLTNLIVLYMNNNLISNIEPLKGLINLNYLEMDNNNISDLEPLRNLTGLINIKMSNNNINDLEPLRNLPRLDQLTMHYNNISNIEPINNISGSFNIENQSIVLDPIKYGIVTHNMFLLNLEGNAPDRIVFSPIGGIYDNNKGTIQWGGLGLNTLTWYDISYKEEWGLLWEIGRFSGTINQYVYTD